MSELRELDRQVAEALGWHRVTHGDFDYYRVTDEQAKPFGLPANFNAWAFQPTTDARQWAVLLEMMPNPCLCITYAEPDAGIQERWRLVTSLLEKVGADEYGTTPGEAVCRAFLAWKA